MNLKENEIKNGFYKHNIKIKKVFEEFKHILTKKQKEFEKNLEENYFTILRNLNDHNFELETVEKKAKLINGEVDLMRNMSIKERLQYQCTDWDKFKEIENYKLPDLVLDTSFKFDEHGLMEKLENISIDLIKNDLRSYYKKNDNSNNNNSTPSNTGVNNQLDKRRQEKTYSKTRKVIGSKNMDSSVNRLRNTSARDKKNKGSISGMRSTLRYKNLHSDDTTYKAKYNLNLGNSSETYRSSIENVFSHKKQDTQQNGDQNPEQNNNFFRRDFANEKMANQDNTTQGSVYYRTQPDGFHKKRYSFENVDQQPFDVELANREKVSFTESSKTLK